MKSNNSSIVVVFVVVVLLFLLLGGGAMTGGMMDSGGHGSGWMGDRGWMWTPALITLGIGIALGWAIFRKPR
jgi:hypothetical protein